MPSRNLYRLVRKELILERGLKPVIRTIDWRAGYTGPKGANPRKGIETDIDAERVVTAKSRPKGANPRKGIETIRITSVSIPIVWSERS